MAKLDYEKAKRRDLSLNHDKDLKYYYYSRMKHRFEDMKKDLQRHLDNGGSLKNYPRWVEYKTARFHRETAYQELSRNRGL